MPKKILMVDDEPHIARFHQIRLERAGYEVIISLNGKEALEKVEAEKPDMVILDIEMPHMDGFEVLEHLRKHADSHELPAILLNRRAMAAFRGMEGRWKTQGWMSETEYVLIKPCNPVELISFVKRVFAIQEGSEVYEPEINTAPPPPSPIPALPPDNPVQTQAPAAPAQPVSWWRRMQEVWRKIGFQGKR